MERFQGGQYSIQPKNSGRPLRKQNFERLQSGTGNEERFQHNKRIGGNPLGSTGNIGRVSTRKLNNGKLSAARGMEGFLRSNWGV